jgi:hypothetical protein
MSEQIEAGEGWRLIDKHTDKPREGDQYLYWNKWRDRPKPLDPWDFTHTYRRRIPAKPERLVVKEVIASICHLKKKPEAWKVVASIGATFPGTGYLDANEARQLADWLTRYADWREAQGEAK